MLKVRFHVGSLSDGRGYVTACDQEGLWKGFHTILEVKELANVFTATKFHEQIRDFHCLLTRGAIKGQDEVKVTPIFFQGMGGYLDVEIDDAGEGGDE